MSKTYRNKNFPDVKYKDVPEFPGYRIGTDGSVWSCWKLRGKKGVRGVESYLSKNWKQLKPTITYWGHLNIILYKDKKPYSFLIHRLVLLLFVGPCPEGMECRHLDGDPTNNNPSNLCWGTHTENMRDRNRHGTSNAGEQNGRSKLCWTDIKKIRRLFSNGIKRKVLAKKFGISGPNICDIINRKTWK